MEAEVSGDGVVDGLLEELSFGAARGLGGLDRDAGLAGDPAHPRMVAPDQPRRSKASLPTATIASRVRAVAAARRAAW